MPVTVSRCPAQAGQSSGPGLGLTRNSTSRSNLRSASGDTVPSSLAKNANKLGDALASRRAAAHRVDSAPPRRPHAAVNCTTAAKTQTQAAARAWKLSTRVSRSTSFASSNQLFSSPNAADQSSVVATAMVASTRLKCSDQAHAGVAVSDSLALGPLEVSGGVPCRVALFHATAPRRVVATHGQSAGVICRYLHGFIWPVRSARVIPAFGRQSRNGHPEEHCISRPADFGSLASRALARTAPFSKQRATDAICDGAVRSAETAAGWPGGSASMTRRLVTSARRQLTAMSASRASISAAVLAQAFPASARAERTASTASRAWSLPVCAAAAALLSSSARRTASPARA